MASALVDQIAQRSDLSRFAAWINIELAAFEVLRRARGEPIHLIALPQWMAKSVFYPSSCVDNASRVAPLTRTILDRMKFFCVIILIVLATPLNTVSPQEPPLPGRNEAPSPTPSPVARPQLNIPDIPISVEPPTLVPEASPAARPQSRSRAKAAESLSQLDAAFKQSPLGLAAEEQRLHLEWRQLQNRVANDSEVVAAKAATTTARTDLEKRVKMRQYYEIYYAHMQALASSPEVKNYLEGKKAAALGGLAQNRVRATPTPQRSAGHR